MGQDLTQLGHCRQ